MSGLNLDAKIRTETIKAWASDSKDGLDRGRVPPGNGSKAYLRTTSKRKLLQIVSDADVDDDGEVNLGEFLYSCLTKYNKGEDPEVNISMY